VSASLLKELGYTDIEAPHSKRTRLDSAPKSPTFSPDSPDYYPSEEENGAEQSELAAQNAEYEQLFEESQVALAKAESKTAEVVQTLEALRYQHGRLRSRVIYLEGELAVYQRFASIDCIESRQRANLPNPPTYRVIVAPPPPPPPRRA
jgi:hypothetical protein